MPNFTAEINIFTAYYEPDKLMVDVTVAYLHSQY